MIIIIPTYNENENVAAMADGIREVLSDVKILFVDDNSPDGTAEEIKKLQSTKKDILLIQRSGKLGLASAYREAFTKVINENLSDVVVTMDGDLSHPFSVLNQFKQNILEYDFVVGSRYCMDGEIENWNIFRRIISRLGNWYSAFFNNLPIKDSTSGFMAIRTELLSKIGFENIRSRGYGFFVELKKAMIESGAKFIELPIKFTERKTGKSKFSGRIIGEAILLPLKLNSVVAPGIFVFLISLIAYLLTMPRSIFFNDNAEFITASKVLGIPHPTGYPLYVILSHLFTYLPIGSIAFRVNLFSAVCASSAVLILYIWFSKVLKNLLPNPYRLIIAAVSTLSIAFSSLFWSQAIIAKTYGLNLLIFSFILLMLWKWWETGKHKYFYLTCFLTGIGLTNHSMMVLLIPSIFLGLLYGIKNTNWKVWVFGILFGIAGLMVYLYLPLRSLAHPAYEWGQPIRSIKSFLNFVFPTEYYKLGLGSSFKDKLSFIQDFWATLMNELGAMLILVVLGMFAAARKQPKLFSVMALAILGNILGILFLRSLVFAQLSAYYYSFYYLPAIVLCFIFMGFGLFFIYDKLQPRIGFRVRGLSVIYVLVPLIFLVTNFNDNNLRKFDFLQEYTEKSLQSLEPNAYLLFSLEGPGQDSVVFGLLYQQLVAKVRPDVTVIGLPGVVNNAPDPGLLYQIYGSKTLEELRKGLVDYVLVEPEVSKNPIYTTYLSERPDFKLHSYSNGLVYRLTLKTHSPYTSAQSLDISDSDKTIAKNDLGGSDAMANYYYAQAAYLLDHGQNSDSEYAFIDGLNFDYNISGLDQTTFMNYRNTKQ